jgi:hypothetical protein
MFNSSTDASSSRAHLSGESFTPVPVSNTDFRSKSSTSFNRDMPSSVKTQEIARQTFTASPLDNRSSTMVIGESVSLQTNVSSQMSEPSGGSVLLRSMKDDAAVKAMEQKLKPTVPEKDRVHAVIGILSQDRPTDYLIYFLEQKNVDLFSQLETTCCNSDERKTIYCLLDQLQRKISHQKTYPNEAERPILAKQGKDIQKRRNDYIDEIRKNLARKKKEFSSIASNRASHSRSLTPSNRGMPKEDSTVKTQRAAEQTLTASLLKDSVLVKNMENDDAAKTMEKTIEGMVGEENQARAAADILSSVVTMEHPTDYLIHFLQQKTNLVLKLQKGFFNAEEEGNIVLLLTKLQDGISYQKSFPKQYEKSILAEKEKTIRDQRDEYIKELRASLLEKKGEFTAGDSRRGIKGSQEKIKNIFERKLEPHQKDLEEKFNISFKFLNLQEKFVLILILLSQLNVINSLDILVELNLQIGHENIKNHLYQELRPNMLDKETYNQFGNLIGIKQDFLNQEQQDNLNSLEQQNSFQQNPEEETPFPHFEMPLGAPPLSFEPEQSYSSNKFEREQQNSEGNMGFSDFSTSLDTPLYLVSTDAINSNTVQNVPKRSNSAMTGSSKKIKLSSDWEDEFAKYKEEREKDTPDKKALFEAITSTLFSLESNKSAVLNDLYQIHQEQRDFFEVLVETFDADDHPEEEKNKIHQTLVSLQNKVGTLRKKVGKQTNRTKPMEESLRQYSESLILELKEAIFHFAPSDRMGDNLFREKLTPVLKECLQHLTVPKKLSHFNPAEKILMLLIDKNNLLDPQEILKKLEEAGIDLERDFYPRLRSKRLGEPVYSSYRNLIKEKEEFLRQIRQNSSLQNQEEAIVFQDFAMSSGTLPVPKLFPDLDLE